MDHITFLVAVVIVTALVFDFTNGFHDTANAMATSIATGALRPKTAGLAALPATYFAHRPTRRVREDSATRGFRFGQIASASMVSLAHGTNDAQKTMGIITLALISCGALHSGAEPPVWVITTAGLAIALGTYLGGRRIIRTMGRGLTGIRSPQGFAAETGSTAVILPSAHLGFALSTTQVCSGGILGAGLGRRLAEVRWSTAGRTAAGWLVTLSAAAGGLMVLEGAATWTWTGMPSGR